MGGVAIPDEFQKEAQYAFSLKHQSPEIPCWELLGYFLAILSEVDWWICRSNIESAPFCESKSEWENSISVWHSFAQR